MQIHKIRQYSFSQLVVILCYRLLMTVRTELRGLWVRYIRREYPVANVEISTLLSTRNKCSDFFKYINVKDCDVEYSDEVINGRITTFGKVYSFDYHTDWLKDPISRIDWPRSVYGEKSSVILNGAADVKYILELNKLNHLVYYAMAYFKTKDDKYINQIVSEITGWKRCVPKEMSVANKIVMDLAYRAINLIQVSLLCADSLVFQTKVFPHIMGILKHHESQIWYYACSRWYKSGNDNNHNVGELVGLYVIQIWLHTFNVGSYENRIEKELRYLDEVLNKLIARSGAYIEQSSNYTRIVAEFLMIFDLMHNCLDNDRTIVWQNKNYLGRLSYYLNQIAYRGNLLNFGDNDDGQVLLAMSHHGHIEHILSYCRDKRIFAGESNYSDASQWLYSSHDGNDIKIFTRIGKFAYFVEGAFIHAHNDILSILLSAKGTNIFIDKGCYFYNSGKEIRKEFASITAHNTISVDGREMADFLSVGYKNYPESHLVLSDYSPNHCHCIGELKYADIIHIREIEYDGCVIRIKDTIESKEKHKSAILKFLLSPDIKVQEEKGSFILVDPKKGNHFRMRISNVSKFQTNETFYSPSYGRKCSTHEIVCVLNLTELKTDLITEIELA